MKRFRFPLERVLDLRRQQQDLELGRLEALAGQRAALERQAGELEELSRICRAACAATTSIEALDLRRTYDYARALEQARLQALGHAAAVEGRRREQMVRLMEARRRVRLLETLRDGLRKRHQQRADREAEAVATDLFLGRLLARTGRNAPGTGSKKVLAGVRRHDM